MAKGKTPKVSMWNQNGKRGPGAAGGADFAAKVAKSTQTNIQGGFAPGSAAADAFASRIIGTHVPTAAINPNYNAYEDPMFMTEKTKNTGTGGGGGGHPTGGPSPLPNQPGITEIGGATGTKYKKKKY